MLVCKYAQNFQKFPHIHDVYTFPYYYYRADLCNTFEQLHLKYISTFLVLLLFAPIILQKNIFFYTTLFII